MCSTSLSFSLPSIKGSQRDISSHMLLLLSFWHLNSLLLCINKNWVDVLMLVGLSSNAFASFLSFLFLVDSIWYLLYFTPSFIRIKHAFLFPWQILQFIMKLSQRKENLSLLYVSPSKSPPLYFMFEQHPRGMKIHSKCEKKTRVKIAWQESYARE